MEIGIEVKYVSKNQEQETVYLEEVIDAKDIISFRPWKKGERDMDVEGGITFVLLKPNPWAEKVEDREKNRKLLLAEEYSSFMKRMRSNGVLVK